MEYGIGIGVGISLCKILYEFLSATLASEFKTDEETQLNYIVLKPMEGLRFPSVDSIRKCVNKFAVEHTLTHRIIVLDCLKWPSLDYTVAAALVSLIKSFKKNSKILVLLNVNPLWNAALMKAGLSSDDLAISVCEDDLGLRNLLKLIPGGYSAEC